MSALNPRGFPVEVPAKPSGYYAHLVMLRVTESYPLFQTDGELNTARVAAGVVYIKQVLQVEQLGTSFLCLVVQVECMFVLFRVGQ